MNRELHKEKTNNKRVNERARERKVKQIVTMLMIKASHLILSGWKV